MISSSLEFPSECISKDISVYKYEVHSNIISAGMCDNYNINVSGKSAKIVQYKILILTSNSASISSPGFLEKADNSTLSNFNSNCENLSSSS